MDTNGPLSRLRHHVSGAIARGEAVAIVEQLADTLTYKEAHDTVDAAAQLGALADLAAHWELAGHWNANAVWTADALHQHVDDSTLALLEAGWDSRDGSNPPTGDDDSDTGLTAWEGVL